MRHLDLAMDKTESCSVGTPPPLTRSPSPFRGAKTQQASRTIILAAPIRDEEPRSIILAAPVPEGDQYYIPLPPLNDAEF